MRQLSWLSHEEVISLSFLELVSQAVSTVPT